MGGAPRNPAPRIHFWVWIAKPSGCHCTDVFGGNEHLSRCDRARDRARACVRVRAPAGGPEAWRVCKMQGYAQSTY